MKGQLRLAALAALVVGIGGPAVANAQNLDPNGTWTVTPFEGCTAILAVDPTSATWKSDCALKNGQRSTVNEVATRRDLGNGQFEFDVVAAKSSVSNYTMDSKIVLKMSGACSATLDAIDPQEHADIFKTTRTGPGC